MAQHRRAKSKPIGSRNFRKSKKHGQKEIIPENEVDAFSAKREYIGLQRSEQVDESDDDDVSDEEEILPLDLPESQSESEESEEEEDYIEEAESVPKNERRENKIKSEQLITTAWGKKKNIFYGSEAADFEIDSESENDAREEEEEAVRQQNMMFSKMDEADFGADDLVAITESQTKSAPEDFESKIVRNLDAMTTEEKLGHIAKDSPELLGLLQELTKVMDEIRDKINKGADQQVEGAGPEGISLISVQHHLLLHYCVCLVFYLLMKSEGRPVRGHPVIDRLITIRTMLERITPIRSKIAYIVDKIVREQPMSSDPLRFKPSVDDQAAAGEQSEPDSDHTNDVNNNNNIYVPPKHRMVPYEEENGQKSKKEERKLRRLHGSEFMQSLRHEFSSAPEELQTHEDDDYESEDERERRQFEEDNLLRLSEPKKKTKTKSSIVNEFDDFEDITGLLGNNQGSDDDDNDELQALRKAKYRAKSSVKDDEHLQSAIASASHYDDVDDDDFDFYSAAQKKAEKAAKVKAERQAAKKQQNVKYVEDVAEARRGVSKKIMENRGIKRYRNKEDKNPRVKHRRRFEKAMVKRKGLVKEFSQKQSMAYGGESTGIKPHLSRSVSFK